MSYQIIGWYSGSRVVVSEHKTLKDAVANWSVVNTAIYASDGRLVPLVKVDEKRVRLATGSRYA